MSSVLNDWLDVRGWEKDKWVRAPAWLSSGLSNGWVVEVWVSVGELLPRLLLLLLLLLLPAKAKGQTKDDSLPLRCG